MDIQALNVGNIPRPNNTNLSKSTEKLSVLAKKSIHIFPFEVGMVTQDNNKFRNHAGCPNIGNTAASPLVINSTAMDKIIKPNTRVITFIPVVPSKASIFSAINKQSNAAKATVAITQTASTS